jgi:gliding motility-associated-like protein
LLQNYTDRIGGKTICNSSGFLEEFYACDDGADTTDGISTFDFSSVTAQIEAVFPLAIDVYYYENEADATSEINEIPDPSNHQNTNSPRMQEIWVRADSQLGNDCLGNGHHVTLFVNSLPQFEVEAERIVCLNLPPITLEIFNANDIYSYVWTDENNAIISNQPTAQVSVGGVYSVVASFTYPDGTVCQSEVRTTTVSESIIADINLDDVTITDDSDNNTITINNANNNLGIGDYEFALDDGNGGIGFYQDNPFFENVAPGIRTIYVQDKNNCGVATLEVAVIGYPKFFTPNNDGENDTWQIKGVSDGFFVNSTIYIFDRFGKMIAKIDPTSQGWDGYYNGEALPSSDYWFTAELIDQDGNIRNRKGHFSLVRR